MGAGTSPAERKFFLCGNPCTLLATSQRLTFTKFGHETYFGVPSKNPERRFWKIFTLGVIFSKISDRNTVKQAPHSEQATGQGMHCRKILFTPRCSPRARSFRGGRRFSTTYGCGATGHQFAQLSDFGLFSNTKRLKMYLLAISLQPSGYIAE